MAKIDDEQAKIAETIRIAAAGPDFFLERLECADGTRKKIDSELAQENHIKSKPVGQYCMSVIEFSANAERSPSTMAARPDYGIQAPYAKMLKDMGLKDSTITPKDLMDFIANNVLGQPDVANKVNPSSLTKPISITITGATAKLPIAHGTAWDVGASEVAEEARRGKTIPEPSRTVEQLVPLADKCFDKITPTNPTDVTFGECKAGGADHMRAVLNGKGLSTTRLAGRN